MLTHKGTVTLTTDRLVFRRFEIDDAQAMYDNWTTDEKVTKFMTWDIHESVEKTRELLTQWVSLKDIFTKIHAEKTAAGVIQIGMVY